MFLLLTLQHKISTSIWPGVSVNPISVSIVSLLTYILYWCSIIMGGYTCGFELQITVEHTTHVYSNLPFKLLFKGDFVVEVL